MNRLYVVVRGDLTPGLQIAQACHAVSRFAAVFPTQFHEWESGERNIVCLSARDELALWHRRHSLLASGFSLSEFFEPDLGGSLTAIAVEGQAKKALSELPLALAR